jgi:hypothetical protein
MESKLGRIPEGAEQVERGPLAAALQQLEKMRVERERDSEFVAARLAEEPPDEAKLRLDPQDNVRRCRGRQRLPGEFGSSGEFASACVFWCQ